MVSEGIPIEIKNFHDPEGIISTTIGPDVDNNAIVAIGCQPGVAVITDDKPLSSELLAEIEYHGITPWLMNSTPEEMKIIMPLHDLHLIESKISGKIVHKTAIISVIGKAQISIEHELVSRNEYGTRLIVQTDKLQKQLVSCITLCSLAKTVGELVSPKRIVHLQR